MITKKQIAEDLDFLISLLKEGKFEGEDLVLILSFIKFKAEKE